MTSTDTASRKPGEGAARRGATARYPWLALAVLMLPVLLVSVDNTVLAFAVPQLSAQLHPTSGQLLWLVDIYPLVLGALLVPMGAAADRVGRRRMLLLGGAGFAAVSAIAAFAPSAGYLIAARAGMAIFGATLMPSTLSLIRNIFTDAAKRRLAIAVWAAGFAAGAALGPIVGGFLLEHFSWGSIFLMAVPILLPFLVLAPLVVPESKDPHPGRLDVVSVLLALGAMAPLVYGITALATGRSGLFSLGFIAVGAGFGAVFVHRQIRVDAPLLDVSLFRNRVFRGSVVINLLSVFALVGFIFFVTQDLQLVMGLDPIPAAVVLVPGLVTTVIAGLLVVPIVGRVRPAIVVSVNFTLAAAGYGLVAVVETTPTVILAAFVILGIGIGAGETVSNDLILSNAPAQRAGSASAISETAYEVGAALGTVVIGGVITAHFRATLVVPPGIPDASAADTLGGAISLAERLSGPAGPQLLSAAREAFASGSAIAAGIGALLMVTAAAFGAVALRGAKS